MHTPVLIDPQPNDGPREPHLAALHAPAAYAARVRAEHALSSEALLVFEQHMYGCETRALEPRVPPPAEVLAGYAAYVLLRAARAHQAARLRAAHRWQAAPRVPLRHARRAPLDQLLAHGMTVREAHSALACLRACVSTARDHKLDGNAASNLALRNALAEPACATGLEQARTCEQEQVTALLTALDATPRHPHVVSRIRAARVLARYKHAASGDALAAWLGPDLDGSATNMLVRGQLLEALACLCARRGLVRDAALRMRADPRAWQEACAHPVKHCTCQGQGQGNGSNSTTVEDVVARLQTRT